MNQECASQAGARGTSPAGDGGTARCAERAALRCRRAPAQGSIASPCYRLIIIRSPLWIRPPTVQAPSHSRAHGGSKRPQRQLLARRCPTAARAPGMTDPPAGDPHHIFMLKLDLPAPASTREPLARRWLTSSHGPCPAGAASVRDNQRQTNSGSSSAWIWSPETLRRAAERAEGARARAAPTLRNNALLLIP